MTKNKSFCILGIPGSGKTTLGKKLLELYDIKFLEEDWRSISFLKDENIKTSSIFEINIGFLNMRHGQCNKLKLQIENSHVALDTCFEMGLIYAKKNMKDYEFVEYKKAYNCYKHNIVDTDYYVYLKGDTDTILERMNERNKEINGDIISKVNITKNDLENYRNDIEAFLCTKSIDKIIEIDITILDTRGEGIVRGIFDKILKETT